MQSPELLNVYSADRPVGILSRESGQLTFKYRQEWLDAIDGYPLSLSLPLRQAPYVGPEVRTWFGNLLPEGDVLNAVARRLGRSTSDVFGLLYDLGGECAGAISMRPPEMPVLVAGRYQKIEDAELFRLVSDERYLPLLAGDGDIRLSLAGAQNKIPLFVDEEKIYKPGGTLATTHIIKPPILSAIHLRCTVENEAYCMRLASKLGLNVPRAEIRTVKGQNYYLIERFDRYRTTKGIQRLHQEDFCQALSIEANLKYEESGGPSLAMIWQLIRTHSSAPAADGQQFLRWICFNFLIGNADAHGKNIALLYSEDGSIRLAPFYDLLSTAIYPELDLKFAMRIGGERRLDKLRRRHWEKLAEDLDLSPKAVFRELKRLTQTIESKAEELTHEFWGHCEAETMSRIVEIIGRRTGKAWAFLGGRPD